MDIFAELKDSMKCHTKINDKKVITYKIPSKGISNIRFREHLMENGYILEADENRGLYIVVVEAGVANKNPAIVGAMLKDNELYITSYAKEGLINQRTAEKAAEKIMDMVSLV